MEDKIYIKDPFNWMLPYHSGDYADSTVLGLTGPKRSCKSLEYAKILYKRMAAGKKVWSNLPVCTPKFLLDKGFPMLRSKEIDWDAFYSMSEEYQDGIMGLDEAGGINSNRGSLSTRNRVSNSFYNQVGHRNLDIVWAAKSSGWLDRQGLGYETDIEVICQDMAKTRWGRLNNVKKGTLVHLQAWDRSGSLTGRVADRRDKFARPFKEWYDSTPYIYWTSYSTKQLQSIEEIFGSLKLDIQKRVISNKTLIDGDISKGLYDISSQFKKSSNKIDINNFWELVSRAGIPGDSRHLGKYLKNMGIDKKQRTDGSRYYDLKNMKNIEFGGG